MMNDEKMQMCRCNKIIFHCTYAILTRLYTFVQSTLIHLYMANIVVSESQILTHDDNGASFFCPICNVSGKT